MQYLLIITLLHNIIITLLHIILLLKNPENRCGNVLLLVPDKRLPLIFFRKSVNSALLFDSMLL